MSQSDNTLLVARGAEALATKRFPEAIKIYKELIARSPENATFLTQLGLSLEGANQLEEAEKVFLESIDKNPQDPQAMLMANRFRTTHSHSLSIQRPKLLVGGGAAVAEGKNYWALSLMERYDLFLYWGNSTLPPGKSSNAPWFISGAPFNVILDFLPPSWNPELVLHFIPEFNAVPDGIEDSIYPTVALIQDLFPRGNSLLRSLDLFDQIGLFETGNIALMEAIVKHPIAYTPGNGLNVFHVKESSTEETYDVVFLCSLDQSQRDPAYLERDKIAKQLLALSTKHRILVSSSLGDLSEHGPNYVHALNSAKIGICHSTAQKIHPTLCEIMGCGKLAFLNADNEEALKYLQDGVDLVSYTEETLEEKLDYYLTHEEERKKIAKTGQAKILSQFTLAEQLQKTYNTLTCQSYNGKRRTREKSMSRFLLDRGIANFYALNLSAAYRDFQSVLTNHNPHSPETINNLALTYFLNERLGGKSGGTSRQAEETLRQAVKHDPTYLPALFNLYALRINAEKADYEDLYFQLTEILGKKSSWELDDLSIYYYPEMNSVRPEFLMLPHSRFSFLYSRESIRWAAGLPDASEKLQKLIQGQLLRFRFIEEEAEGKAQEAKPLLYKAASLMEDDPEVLYQLARLHFENNEKEKALESLEVALKNRPLFPQALQMLTQIKA